MSSEAGSEGVGSLAGRAALIAGAGSGIGAATAALLADRGASVVVADIRRENAEKVAAGISDSGGRAIGVEFDISDHRSVEAMFTGSTGQVGPIDLLVNVAGDVGTPTHADDSENTVASVSMDAWDRAIAVGLTGFATTIRHALPSMVERGHGSIVNISSLAAFIGEPVRVSYAVTKSGITALTRHVASAFGHSGIRCNTITPGLTITEAARHAFPTDVLERRAAQNPSGRLGTPTDIAKAVAFLLSDEASWINGQTLAVDGGTTMR